MGKLDTSSIQFKRLISLILFLLYLGCIFLVAQNTPRTYVVHKALDAIKIDGVANETSWEKAQFSDRFIDIEGVKEPKYPTQMKMLWDKEFLYVFAQLEEPHVWANLTKRDTIIFYNNDFEIFVDPNGDSHEYYEFEFNALNTLWDLFITKPYREGNLVLDDWDAKGLKSAVHVNGTLNDPEDRDEGWSIEVAIPLQSFKRSYFEKVDPEGGFWRMNFSRVNWDFQLDEEGQYQRKQEANGKLAHEHNWVWSPQGVVAMHQPETWGYVYFSGKNVGETDVFSIPEDEHIKWFLFELHRKVKAGKNVSGGARNIFGKTILPKFEEHQSGYNIWVDSPFSQKRILIKEDGELTVN